MWIQKGGIVHDDGFPCGNFATTRILGDMKDTEKRAKAVASLGFEGSSVVYAEQIHGKLVAVTGAADDGVFIKGADGLVTAEKGVCLAIFTADCLPILFVVPGKAAAAAHAGWRGLNKGIINEVLDIFKVKFGIAPNEIMSSIGPHICPRCYSIGDEIRKAFELPQAQTHFDLAAEAEAQLRRSGVSKISVCASCTMHDQSMFYSYRNDKTAARIMSLVQL